MTIAAQPRVATSELDEVSRKARIGRLERVLLHIGGVNPDRVAECPLDDRQGALRTGLALTTSFLFVAYAAANALSISFGDRVAALLAGLPAAALIAAAIGLVDHAMIQSHWLEAGLRAAHHRGLRPAEGAGLLGAFTKVWRGLAVGLVRVALSASLAFTIATVLELTIFRTDIAARVDADLRAANAPVLARARAAVEVRIVAAEADVSRLEVSLALAESRADFSLAASPMKKRRTGRRAATGSNGWKRSTPGSKRKLMPLDEPPTRSTMVFGSTT